jgi:hypothetical protein
MFTKFSSCRRKFYVTEPKQNRTRLLGEMENVFQIIWRVNYWKIEKQKKKNKK